MVTNGSEADDKDKTLLPDLDVDWKPVKQESKRAKRFWWQKS